MPSSVPRPQFHALFSRSFCVAAALLASLMNCTLTAAEISDACRQDMEIILNSTELAALFPNQTCLYVDIVPNFCTVLNEGDLPAYEEYCEITLGMQIYHVETLRVCEDADYYNLDGIYCIGTNCSNETEIREVLAEVLFPLPDLPSASTYNMSCNTTSFGEDSAEKQCNAYTENMINYPCLDNLLDRNGDFVRRSQCQPGKNCQMDFTYLYCERNMFQNVCEELDGRYQQVDHIWDCEDSSTGSKFQYSFRNEPFCQGRGCPSVVVPDYKEALKELGYECELATFTTQFAPETSSAPKSAPKSTLVVEIALAWITAFLF